MRSIRKVLICAFALALFNSCASEEKTSELVMQENWWDVHPRPVYSSLEKVGTYQSWFDVYRLSEGTFAIYEPNQFEEAISYLVMGSDRGVIIDTGTGIGDIRQVVEQLTDLPVSVVLTHEHYDHVAGAYRWDEIIAYDNAESLKAMKAGRTNSSLQGYITGEYLWKPLPEGFDPNSWIIPPIEPTSLVKEGDTIDLGGRLLEVIYTPGHSPGSMCLLDQQNRFLFTGDHFFPGPLYAFGPDVDIQDYIDSNKKLGQRIEEFDYICAGHNDPWVSGDVIPRVSEAFEAIFSEGGRFSEDEDLRRYYFNGFDILILRQMVEDPEIKP